jgi:hypothetical protein
MCLLGGLVPPLGRSGLLLLRRSTWPAAWPAAAQYDRRHNRRVVDVA